MKTMGRVPVACLAAGLNVVETAVLQVFRNHRGHHWITTDQQDAWASHVARPIVRATIH
jgi:hypothetical protein